MEEKKSRFLTRLSNTYLLMEEKKAFSQMARLSEFSGMVPVHLFLGFPVVWLDLYHRFSC